MNIRVGTSGWSFNDKENIFYSKELKQKDRLKFYSETFNTVEVNTTFYHFPRETTIEKWYMDTDEDFKFIIKINRYFTHSKKLIIDEDSIEKLKIFINLVEGLQEKLKGILVQIPPSFKINLEVLSRFLDVIKSLNANMEVFLEVREDSWMREEFFQLISRYNVNLVCNDSNNKWPRVLKLTGDTLYIRLHGRERLYYSSYSKYELESILKEVKRFKAPSYIFFNNTASNEGVKNALLLKGLMQ